ncbi:hypothetical protein [Pseudoroseomonas ludipueritiae]|uniref:Apolipoprotein A1/A4/E domain-containing protein n=1 Tax=Pseudoroseomonas ludipueritiae TaxID=198093 RepID=A0ABR7R3C1_9PROT|nr:hypothetical protein [Pseudoroseomonas ludipueritiae]MBC9176147.1 hypothetical protein [Pseudoroseomonas ludipueritiae]
MWLFESSVDLILGLIAGFSGREVAFGVAYLILLASIVIWAVVVWRPHRRFTKALTSACRSVEAAADNQGFSPEDRLAKVDHDLASHALFQHIWKPYRNALRRDPRRDSEYLNPVDPRDSFTLERLPGHGYEKWAATFAGVALTVGLLFTFVGLTAALTKVGHGGADTSQLREAIGEILSISSAKFITSMAGIVAYIGWTLATRFHVSKQEKLASRFATAVQRLSTPVTPESLLIDQLEQARDQTLRLQTFSDDVAVALDARIGARIDAIPQAIGATLQPALENSVRPVVDAITNMGATIGAGNQVALEGLISGLMSGVKESSGREMALLTEAMRETADELKAAKTGIGAGGAELGQFLREAADQMSASAQRMVDAMGGRVSEIDDRMQRIDEMLSSGAERFNTMGSSVSQTLADGMRQAIESIQAAAATGAEAARVQAQAGIGPVLHELHDLMAEMKASAEESRVALTAGGTAAASQLQNALSQAGGNLSDASARASTQLATSFQEVSERILGVVEQRMGEMDARMTKMDQALASGARRFDTMGKSMADAMAEGVEQTIKSMQTAAKSGAVAARSQATAALEPLLVELQATMAGMQKSAAESGKALTKGGRSAADDLAAAVAAVGQNLAGASAEASKQITAAFEASTKRILASVEGSVSGYRSATEGLATRLQTVEQNFQALEVAVRRSAGQVGEAGSAFALAGREVGGAAEQLTQAAGPIQPALIALEKSATGIQEAMRLAQDGTQQMRQAHATLEATAAKVKEVFSNYEGRFVGLDRSLEQAYTAMRDGVGQVGQSMTDVIEKQDAHLASAVGMLKSVIEELRDAVEDIGTKIEEAA